MKGMGSLGSGIAEKLILFSPMDTQLEVRALEVAFSSRNLQNQE